ncbi:hypothetical protein BGP79_14125 [Tersicoccus sp. Bi-70]|nr:hypothetical protein BGP79_14125 [Tersicoccus sp. Bi-70]
MSLADIAALARVQRPVVTTWRSRSRATAHSFPESVDTTGGQERFAVDDVVAWLTATGRGNNPDAATEAVLHAEPDGPAESRRRHADTLTALLTLSAARGERLSGLSRGELIDAADAEDPDDECLYREIAAIEDDDVAAWLSLADRTADAAWNAAAAVERLITDPNRPLGADRAPTALIAPAKDVVAALVVELAASQGQDGNTPVLADRTPGGSDAVPSVLERAEGAVHPVVRLEADKSDAGRLLRRRLSAQHRAWTTWHRTGTAATLHLLQLASTVDARGAFHVLADILLELTDADRGLVLGPASLLVDAVNAKDTSRRADLLRTGRVRCIVRLPTGLLPARSREALALWVLGPATSWPNSEDQFTLVVDLAGRQLDDVVIGDLVSDVAATVAGAHGERDQFAARAFRFGRLVPTRTLVATSGALITGHRSLPATSHSTDYALDVDRLLDAVRTPLPGLDAIDVAVADGDVPSAPMATVDALMAAGRLRCLAGTRLAVDADAEAGTRVIGAHDIGREDGRRHVDLIAFTRAHPAARLTEPGDVVFTTTPQPAAAVDVEGGAVVAFPERILRIDAADPGGLNPAVLAADIAAQHAGDRRWQQWRVHRVSDADSAALAATLARVEAARQETQQRLADLRELTRALIAGVSAGSLNLNPDPNPERTN